MPTGLFLGIIFVLLLIAAELSFRKNAGLHPSGWKEFFKLLNGRNPQGEKIERGRKALLFALVSFLFFPFWEGLIRSLVQSRYPESLSWGGLALFSLLLFLRQRDFKKGKGGLFSREELLLFIAGWIFITHSVLGLAMAPWLLWRGWSLPSRPLRA
jgi:hypothetical protein